MTAIFLLFLLVVQGAVFSGCATGGGSSSGGQKSRGSLSAATAEAAGEEEAQGRGEGRTRTKNEVYESQSTEEYAEEDGDGVLGFLGGVVWSLFSGDDDEEDTRERVPTYGTEYHETGARTWSNSNEFGMPAEGGGSESVPEEMDPGPRPNNITFWWSPSWLAGDAIQGFTNYTLLYSVSTSRKVRIHVGLFYGKGSIGGQENLQEVLKGIFEGGLDTGLRLFFNPENPGHELYLLMGLRLGVMEWSFANPLEVPNGNGGTELISEDDVGVFTPYFGLGTSIIRAGNFQVGASFSLGARLTLDETYEGFDNDVFISVGEYRLNLEASYFF